MKIKSVILGFVLTLLSGAVTAGSNHDHGHSHEPVAQQADEQHDHGHSHEPVMPNLDVSPQSADGGRGKSHKSIF